MNILFYFTIKKNDCKDSNFFHITLSSDGIFAGDTITVGNPQQNLQNCLALKK